jgi:hypothetical protein
LNPTAKDKALILAADYFMALSITVRFSEWNQALPESGCFADLVIEINQFLCSSKLYQYYY